MSSLQRPSTAPPTAHRTRIELDEGWKTATRREIEASFGAMMKDARRARDDALAGAPDHEARAKAQREYDASVENVRVLAHEEFLARARQEALRRTTAADGRPTPPSSAHNLAKSVLQEQQWILDAIKRDRHGQPSPHPHTHAALSTSPTVPTAGPSRYPGAAGEGKVRRASATHASRSATPNFAARERKYSVSEQTAITTTTTVRQPQRGAPYDDNSDEDDEEDDEEGEDGVMMGRMDSDGRRTATEQFRRWVPPPRRDGDDDSLVASRTPEPSGLSRIFAPNNSPPTARAYKTTNGGGSGSGSGSHDPGGDGPTLTGARTRTYSEQAGVPRPPSRSTPVDINAHGRQTSAHAHAASRGSPMSSDRLAGPRPLVNTGGVAMGQRRPSFGPASPLGRPIPGTARGQALEGEGGARFPSSSSPGWRIGHGAQRSFEDGRAGVMFPRGQQTPEGGGSAFNGRGVLNEDESESGSDEDVVGPLDDRIRSARSFSGSWGSEFEKRVLGREGEVRRREEEVGRREEEVRGMMEKVRKQEQAWRGRQEELIRREMAFKQQEEERRKKVVAQSRQANAVAGPSGLARSREGYVSYLEETGLKDGLRKIESDLESMVMDAAGYRDEELRQARDEVERTRARRDFETSVGSLLVVVEDFQMRIGRERSGRQQEVAIKRRKRSNTTA
ncbi:hypothetical protein OF83DRAFT_1168438 [Amylostereum chailletii]|nr:hypothetical protein OF83DRAFT_1168438 [Amylostereum chailletii]